MKGLACRGRPFTPFPEPNLASRRKRRCGSHHWSIASPGGRRRLEHPDGDCTAERPGPGCHFFDSRGPRFGGAGAGYRCADRGAFRGLGLSGAVVESIGQVAVAPRPALTRSSCPGCYRDFSRHHSAGRDLAIHRTSRARPRASGGASRPQRCRGGAQAAACRGFASDPAI
jgi:hypothetical protein